MVSAAACIAVSVNASPLLGSFRPVITNSQISIDSYFPPPECDVAPAAFAPSEVDAVASPSPSVAPGQEPSDVVEQDISEPSSDPSGAPEASSSTESSPAPVVDESDLPTEGSDGDDPDDVQVTLDPRSGSSASPSPSPSTTISPSASPSPSPSDDEVEPNEDASGDRDAPSPTASTTPSVLLSNSDSSPATLAAPYGNPCAPYALNVDTAPTDGIAQITWEQSKPDESLVGHYVVSAIDGQRDIAFHVENPDPNNAGPFSYTMWGLAPDTDHSFTVSARNIWRNYDGSGNFISDEGEASASISGRTQPEALNQKLAPGVVLGIAGSGNTDAVVVNWTEPAEAGDEPTEGYIIYIDGAPTAVVPATTGENGTFAHTLTGLQPGDRTVTVVAYTETTVGGRAATETFTIASVGFNVAYAGGADTLKFDTTQASEVFAPTTENAAGAIDYSLTGTLPEGVTFDSATGTFTGPAAFEKAQTYEIGDTGPGGGIVFATPETQDGYPGQYLEIAKADWGTTPTYYCINNSTYPIPSSTEDGIGLGKTVTESFASSQNCDPDSVIGSVWNQDINGFTDWFVPSGAELSAALSNPVAKAAVAVPTAPTVIYMTTTGASMSDPGVRGWVERFNSTLYESMNNICANTFNCNLSTSYMVLPVRAFVAEASVPLTGWPGSVTVAANDGNTDKTLDLTLTQVGAGEGNANAGGSNDEPALPSYNIGDIGPAGGRVFHIDTVNNIAYESAPAEETRGVTLPNGNTVRFLFSLLETTTLIDETTLNTGNDLNRYCLEYDNAIWYAFGDSPPTTGTALGDGKTNTENIFNACSEGNTYGEPYDLIYNISTLDVGGYDDWYLPSRDEMQLLADSGHTFTTRYQYTSSLDYDPQSEYMRYDLYDSQDNSFALINAVTAQPNFVATPIRSFPVAPPTNISYEIGDVGPGGGVVFATPDTQSGYPGEYLEILPADWGTTPTYYCLNNSTYPIPPSTSGDIGLGKSATKSFATANNCDTESIIGSVWNQDLNGFTQL